MPDKRKKTALKQQEVAYKEYCERVVSIG